MQQIKRISRKSIFEIEVLDVSRKNPRPPVDGPCPTGRLLPYDEQLFLTLLLELYCGTDQQASLAELAGMLKKYVLVCLRNPPLDDQVVLVLL